MISTEEKQSILKIEIMKEFYFSDEDVANKESPEYSRQNSPEINPFPPSSDIMDGEDEKS